MNTEKGKRKRRGKGHKRAELSVPGLSAAGPPWPLHPSVYPLPGITLQAGGGDRDSLHRTVGSVGSASNSIKSSFLFPP